MVSVPLKFHLLGGLENQQPHHRGRCENQQSGNQWMGRTKLEHLKRTIPQEMSLFDLLGRLLLKAPESLALFDLTQLTLCKQLYPLSIC